MSLDEYLNKLENGEISESEHRDNTGASFPVKATREEFASLRVEDDELVEDKELREMADTQSLARNFKDKFPAESFKEDKTIGLAAKWLVARTKGDLKYFKNVLNAAGVVEQYAGPLLEEATASQGIKQNEVDVLLQEAEKADKETAKPKADKKENKIEGSLSRKVVIGSYGVILTEESLTLWKKGALKESFNTEELGGFASVVSDVEDMKTEAHIQNYFGYNSKEAEDDVPKTGAMDTEVLLMFDLLKEHDHALPEILEMISKRLNISSTTVISVLFDSGKITDAEYDQYIDMAEKTSSEEAQPFKEGDRVELVQGDYRGLKGTIEEIPKEGLINVRVDKDDPFLKDKDSDGDYHIGCQPETLKKIEGKEGAEGDGGGVKDSYDSTQTPVINKDSDKLPGGVGDGKTSEDFFEEQMEKGLLVELEHTKDPDIATEIVKDHLTEDPKYYDNPMFKKDLEKTSAGAEDVLTMFESLKKEDRNLFSIVTEMTYRLDLTSTEITDILHTLKQITNEEHGQFTRASAKTSELVEENGEYRVVDVDKKMPPSPNIVQEH